MAFIMIWYVSGLLGVLISIRMHRDNESFFSLVRQDWKLILFVAILGFFNLIVAALDIAFNLKLKNKK